MLRGVRTFVCIAIVTTSSVAAAQLVDPWTPPPAAPADAAVAAPEDAPATPAAPPPPPPPNKPAPAPRPVTLKMRRAGEWIEHPAPIMRPRVLREEPPPQLASEPDEPSPRKYPLELAARPLVLPPGVTELAISYLRTTATVTRPDQYGEVMTTRPTSNTPDLSLSHAFSRAELGIGVGQTLYGWLSIDTQSVPQRVRLSAAFSAPNPSGTYAHFQSIGLDHKLFTDDSKAAAIVLGTSAEVVELNGYSRQGARMEGELVAITPSFVFQAQIVPALAVWFGAGASLPIVESAELDVDWLLAGSTGFLIALDSWDLVASGGIANPTERFATSISLGVRKRWGL